VAIEGRCALACVVTIELEECEIADPLIDRVPGAIPGDRHIRPQGLALRRSGEDSRNALIGGWKRIQNERSAKTRDNSKYFVGCLTRLNRILSAKSLKSRILRVDLAEREGFEPSIELFNPITV
jgi:hypothetical protein